MKKTCFLVLASLLVIGMMSGCAQKANTTQTSYISMDNAHTAALTAAGVDAADVEVQNTQLMERDGITYYEVEFTAEDVDYSYAVDAMTGVVIEAKNMKKQESTVDDGSQVTDYDTVNTDAASSDVPPPAVEAAPAPASVPAAPAAQPANGITLEQAKQTALEHAGKTSAEATFVKTQKEFDDGQWVYEIEFVVTSGNVYQEYDYTISTTTGKILSYDQDAEDYAPQSTTPQSQGSTTKTEDEVRNIALAKVPGAKKEHCTLWLERDDGRVLYEGKIVYGSMEYEFEIDAYSGTVLDWDAESIYD